MSLNTLGQIEHAPARKSSLGSDSMTSTGFAMSRSHDPAQSPPFFVVLLDDLLDKIKHLLVVFLYAGLPCKLAPSWLDWFVDGCHGDPVLSV